MSDTLSATGHCLCGAVTLHAPSLHRHVGACHCGMCRHWGGGPYLSLEAGPDMTIDGTEHLKAYASSEWAERVFCGTCGSHLFYHLKPAGRRFVAAGLFDLDKELVFDHQIYVDKQPAYYRFANETSMMTEAEVIAQYG